MWPLRTADTMRCVSKWPDQLGLAVFAVGLTVVGLIPAWVAASDIYRWHHDPHGTVAVQECWLDRWDSKSHIPEYVCVGDYTSDHGDLRVPGVILDDEGDHDHGAKVRATVSGRYAHRAYGVHPVRDVFLLIFSIGMLIPPVLVVMPTRRPGHDQPTAATAAVAAETAELAPAHPDDAEPPAPRTGTAERATPANRERTSAAAASAAVVFERRFDAGEAV